MRKKWEILGLCSKYYCVSTIYQFTSASSLYNHSFYDNSPCLSLFFIFAFTTTACLTNSPYPTLLHNIPSAPLPPYLHYSLCQSFDLSRL